MASTLAQHFLSLLHAHIALAVLSVTLYVARVAGVLAGAHWPMERGVRRASVAIDTLLIAAGGTLWWLLSLNPVRDHWLLAKLVLIVAYIVLGSLAMKRARSVAGKSVAFAASLLCIGTVLAVVLTHEPWPFGSRPSDPQSGTQMR